MKKRHRDNRISDVIPLNKNNDAAYVRHMEIHITGLLRRNPLKFQDIVCLAGGAYPTDVRRILRNLVAQKRLEKDGELYCLPGFSKNQSLESDTINLTNSSTIVDKHPSFKNLASEHIFADPHPADYDWRFTSATIAELTRRLNPFVESKSKIALFGTPTLFLSLYRSGANVTLFDNSYSILSDLKAIGFNNELVHHNLFDPLPQFAKKYEVIVADPPWYMPFHKAFILRSSELLKKQGLLMLSVPPWLTRPSAVENRANIIVFAIKAGFDLSDMTHGALFYESPRFERIALSVQDIRCGSWRIGDLFTFHKIKEASSSLKVPYPKDEPNWDEYRFKQLKVKLRQRTNIDDGKLKIKPVSDEGLYLDTVSRRYPLRNRIDIWTSDNVAYSVNRIDIVKLALDRLQKDEFPHVITSGLKKKIGLSKTEAEALSKLLTEIKSACEHRNFGQAKIT